MLHLQNDPSAPPLRPDPLMTVKETATYLRVSKSYLDKARLTGHGPPFIRLGHKILYRKSAVDGWLQQRQFTATSQYTINRVLHCEPTPCHEGK